METYTMRDFSTQFGSKPPLLTQCNIRISASQFSRHIRPSTPQLQLLILPFIVIKISEVFWHHSYKMNLPWHKISEPHTIHTLINKTECLVWIVPETIRLNFLLFTDEVILFVYESKLHIKFGGMVDAVCVNVVK